MTLSEIIGQNAVVDTLRRTIARGTLHHAYIFSGLPGVGKRTTALALAQTLNCESNGRDACDLCSSCRKIQHETHPDVFTVGLPEGKKRIPIDDIRDLERRVATRPHEGRTKIAIIDPADLMTEPAANALLKTLEEPRPATLLVLLTARLDALLPTVRSRCQILRFRPLLPDIIVPMLRRSGEVSDELASLAAVFGGGSLDKATLFLGEQTRTRIDSALALLTCAFEATPLRGLAVVETARRDRDEALALIESLIIMSSAALLLSVDPDGSHAIRPLLEAYRTPLSRIAAAGPERLAAFIAAAESTAAAISRNNANPQLALEGLLVTLRGRDGHRPVGSGFAHP
ncbi:MAG: DNA polymerase III subunit delta' [Myxococcota bacterium]|jgi:DNA polymerase-3 subunit delta'|nr:DNA polymerase III subunit delta' [Myxococcota bacterium]